MTRAKKDFSNREQAETEHFYLHAGKLTRQFHLPFALYEVGFINSHPIETTVTNDVLELCLRLGSNAEYASDRIDEEIYRCRFPHVCLKTPGRLHVTAVEAPRDAVYFKYTPKQAEFFQNARMLTPPWCWEFQMTPELSTILQEVRNLMERSCEFGVPDQLDVLALRLFQKLLIARDSGREECDLIDVRIQRIASYLSLHIFEEVDLDKLLRQNSLSRRNFYRYWEAAFGQTPASYLKELRLKAALRLLQETREPVWSIASKLNFRSEGYFCQLFRERFGITPLRCRKWGTKTFY